jgi:Ca-activated chloride channel family protein
MKTPSTTFQNSWQSLATGGVGSILLHAAALLILGLSLRGCQSLGHGTPGGDPFRQIGLVVVDGVDGGAAAEGMVPGAGDDATTQNGDAASQQSESVADIGSQINGPVTNRVPQEAPDLNSLMSPSESSATMSGEFSSDLPQLIGTGRPIGGLPRSKSGGGGSLIQPSEAGGATKIGGVGGPGDTSFMEISGVGQTFTYVIDTSSSMDGNRLKLAQSQLKASLRLLQPHQKFSIILYNELPQQLKLRRRAEEEFYPASQINISLMENEIDLIRSSLGTSHMPALLEALNSRPDVIYFLTDGAEPELSQADLKQLARRTGKTTIHVIQFSDGTLSERGLSWMERLAQQSNGEFRQLNVKGY